MEISTITNNGCIYAHCYYNLCAYIYCFAVNHENWTIDLLKTEFRNKKVILSSATAATREELSKQLKDHKKAAELKSYEFLIEVVNDIELKTAICQMDGEIYQCKVCDNLTHSESTYFYGKWGRVPVVVVQTGKKVGSQFQYGSWFETKKALYYMPELKHVFGVGVCGAAVDDNSGKPRVPLGYVVVSSHIIGYDHQKKKEEGDENRSFSSDMSEQSFYRFLSDVTNMGNWEEGLHFGRVLSGSWLVADINAQKLVLDSSRNDEIAFEMEGVGIAAACQNARNVHVEDWLVVKGVSDYANRDKSDAWQPAAASNAIHYLSDMINMKVTYSYMHNMVAKIFTVAMQYCINGMVTIFNFLSSHTPKDFTVLYYQLLPGE